MERRHVTFANADIVSPSRKLTSQPPAFPRPRTFTDDGPSRGIISSRPTLGSRSISLGRSRNQFTSLQSPSSLDEKVGSTTADVGEFENAFSDLTAEYHGHSAVRPTKLISNRHRRVQSAVPTGFTYRGGNSSSGDGAMPAVATLTTPAERARFVALSMKAKVVDSFDEPNKDFPDLMGILEARRYHSNECSSNGSQPRSGGGGGTSHKSGDEEAGRSGGGGGGGFRSEWKHRPFSGISSSPFFSNYGVKSNVDQLFRVVENVQELCKIPESDEADAGEAKSDVLAEENAEFLSRLSSYPVVPPVYVDAADNSAADEQTPLVEPSDGPQKVKSKLSPRGGLTSFASFTQLPTPGSRFYTLCVWWNELSRQLKMLAVAFDGAYVKERIWTSFQNDVFMFIIPLLSISAFFYYQLNNPILPIFSTDASISWWILFFIRHYVTLLVSGW
jgi:hypothetical protein